MRARYLGQEMQGRLIGTPARDGAWRARAAVPAGEGGIGCRGSGGGRVWVRGRSARKAPHPLPLG